MNGPQAVPLDALRELVASAGAQAPSVSHWSVGRHVAHCCLAMSSILESLVGSTPPPPPRGFSFRRLGVLRLGWIPRGRAQAPEPVVVDDEPDEARLQELLTTVGEQLAGVGRLPTDAWFQHFVLGVMVRDECLRFLAVHNAHHVKIARDILGRT